jgi:hypothetical protein
MSSRKRGHDESNTCGNASKHLKLKNDETECDNNTIKVVDKQPTINENVSEPNNDDDDNEYYSSGELINRCVTCHIDMGECNPRQYCGKWKCDSPEYDQTQ